MVKCKFLSYFLNNSWMLSLSLSDSLFCLFFILKIETNYKKYKEITNKNK